jgi:DNA-binding protein H-NS
MPLSPAASRLSGHPFGCQSNPRVSALRPHVEVRGTFKATKAAVGVKAEVAPKYLHPKTGATWSGHARPPAWIAKVKDRSKFLIAGGADTAVAASADAVSNAKSAAKEASAVAGKGQRKGPQPAKYRDPETGATWSEPGPAPAWLASAKDRTRFLIAGASAVVTDATTVSKASKPKAAGKSGVVAKKATAPEKEATKAPAEKDFAESTKAVAPAAKKSVAKKTPVRKARAVKTAVATADAITAPESATVEASA